MPDCWVCLEPDERRGILLAFTFPGNTEFRFKICGTCARRIIDDMSERFNRAAKVKRTRLESEPVQ